MINYNNLINIHDSTAQVITVPGKAGLIQFFSKDYVQIGTREYVGGSPVYKPESFMIIAVDIWKIIRKKGDQIEAYNNIFRNYKCSLLLEIQYAGDLVVQAPTYFSWYSKGKDNSIILNHYSYEWCFYCRIVCDPSNGHPLLVEKYYYDGRYERYDLTNAVPQMMIDDNLDLCHDKGIFIPFVSLKGTVYEEFVRSFVENFINLKKLNLNEITPWYLKTILQGSDLTDEIACVLEAHRIPRALWIESLSYLICDTIKYRSFNMEDLFITYVNANDGVKSIVYNNYHPSLETLKAYDAKYVEFCLEMYRNARVKAVKPEQDYFTPEMQESRDYIAAKVAEMVLGMDFIYLYDGKIYFLPEEMRNSFWEDAFHIQLELENELNLK